MALPLEFLALAAGLAASGAMLVRGSLAVIGERQLERRLDGLRDDAARAPTGRFAPGGLLPTLLAGGSEDRIEIERALTAAGFIDPTAVLTFGLIRLGLTVAAGLGAYLARTISQPAGSAAWAMTIAAAAFVFLGSKYILRMSSARRSRKISAELPFTLDIFVMMVESGASLDQCFRIFAAAEGRAAPIVRAAVVLLVEDIQRGMAYDLALARWADRLGVAGARELAGVLRQSLVHGSELAAALREFSREFAERRVFVARESIGRKTTQMTIAMLVLLMPALMIVLAGPAVSTIGATIQAIIK